MLSSIALGRRRVVLRGLIPGSPVRQRFSLTSELPVIRRKVGVNMENIFCFHTKLYGKYSYLKVTIEESLILKDTNSFADYFQDINILCFSTAKFRSMLRQAATYLCCNYILFEYNQYILNLRLVVVWMRFRNTVLILDEINLEKGLFCTSFILNT